MYAYNASGDAWTQIADFKGTARTNATAFSIGTKGYVTTGYDGNNNVYLKDVMGI